MQHNNLINEIETDIYKKFDWKDMLYIVPPVLLLAYIIIRSIF